MWLKIGLFLLTLITSPSLAASYCGFNSRAQLMDQAQAKLADFTSLCGADCQLDSSSLELPETMKEEKAQILNHPALAVLKAQNLPHVYVPSDPLYIFPYSDIAIPRVYVPAVWSAKMPVGLSPEEFGSLKRFALAHEIGHLVDDTITRLKHQPLLPLTLSEHLVVDAIAILIGNFTPEQATTILSYHSEEYGSGDAPQRAKCLKQLSRRKAERFFFSFKGLHFP